MKMRNNNFLKWEKFYNLLWFYIVGAYAHGLNPDFIKDRQEIL